MSIENANSEGIMSGLLMESHFWSLCFPWYAVRLEGEQRERGRGRGSKSKHKMQHLIIWSLGGNCNKIVLLNVKHDVICLLWLAGFCPFSILFLAVVFSYPLELIALLLRHSKKEQSSNSSTYQIAITREMTTISIRWYIG